MILITIFQKYRSINGALLRVDPDALKMCKSGLMLWPIFDQKVALINL